MPAPSVYETSANLFNQAAAGPNTNQFMNPYADQRLNINQYMNPYAGQRLNTNQYMNPYADQKLNTQQFMNPYTDQVINQSMADLERQRQTQINATGAAASQAGAFGGSRHGVAEAQTNLGFGQQGAQMASDLRQQGFNTALQAAQAQRGQQIQNYDTAMQTAQNQQGVQIGNYNTALQAAQNQQGVQIGNYNTALQAAQNQQGVQSNLAQQGFGFGQALNQQQFQQGQQQQMLNQSLIDATRGQYGGFANNPQNSLSMLMSSLGYMPNQSTQTNTQNPGLFDYASAAVPFI
jgi:hypothetical protein